MDRIEIKGRVNTAICYAKVVEDEAIEQIRRMCDYIITEGSRIRIMPDVHAGKGCTIGTTMTIHEMAVPNIVGVDGFFDAAAITSDVKAMFNDLSVNDFYFSFGPGLRFLLPQFPLHLLYAWTFKHSDAKGWHFNDPNGVFVLSFNITNR